MHFCHEWILLTTFYPRGKNFHLERFFAAAGIEPRSPASQALLHGLSGSYVIGTKPRRFGNVVAVQDPGEKKSTQVLPEVGGEKKIQKFSSPGHTGEELLLIFPCRGQSRLTKMCKFLAKMCKFLEENVIIISFRGLLVRKKSTFFLPTRKKICFFDPRNSSHAPNRPDLSRQMVSREKTLWLNGR